jgi:hypothetical protein
MASNHFDSSPGAFASQTNKHWRTSTSEPSTSESSASRQKKPRLPVEFPTSDYSVVCGRGKDSFDHVGNHRFRILAKLSIERYSNADSRTEKSAIVSEIIAVIHQAGGIFCNFKKGEWCEVGDHQAREKVSSLMRDLLHTQYRSSAKAKVDRRTSMTMKQNQNQNQVQDQQSSQKRVDSDDCSTTSSSWGTSENSLGFEYWLEEPADFFEIDVFED